MSWDDDRIGDRFNGIDRALEDAQYHIRTFAPVAAQVGVLESSLTDARTDLKELRAEYKMDRANNRAEIVKLVSIVVGSFIAAVGTVAAAVATGLVGG